MCDCVCSTDQEYRNAHKSAANSFFFLRISEDAKSTNVTIGPGCQVQYKVDHSNAAAPYLDRDSSDA